MSEQHVRAVSAACWPVVVRYCRALVGRSPQGWDRADTLAHDLYPRAVAAVIAECRSGVPAPDALLGCLARAFDGLAEHEERLAHPAPTTPLSIVLRSSGPRTAAVLWLRVIEKRTTPETAAVLGIRKGEVQVLQHRALQRLHMGAVATG
jgi:Sigma-70, region 4